MTDASDNGNTNDTDTGANASKLYVVLTSTKERIEINADLIEFDDQNRLCFYRGPNVIACFNQDSWIYFRRVGRVGVEKSDGHEDSDVSTSDNVLRMEFKADYNA